jgi:SAM-dependent methyltransferase
MFDFFFQRILTGLKQINYAKLKKKIGQRLFKISFPHLLSDDILNEGERYDPFLFSFSGGWYNDNCHLARYKFAKQFIDEKDAVLDIACGTGYGTALLSTGCRSITGVDLSQKAIEFAINNYSKPNIQFINSDIFECTITADVVITFETIEHIKDGTIEKILQKLLSYSTAKIIGSIPYREIPGENIHHYLFHLDESSLRYLQEFGEVTFYYQTPDGFIHTDKPNKSIQNVIFVFVRK